VWLRELQLKDRQVKHTMEEELRNAKGMGRWAWLAAENGHARYRAMAGRWQSRPRCPWSVYPF